MISTTNYYHNIDTLYVPINREQEPKPFEIHKNTVSFNNDIQKGMYDWLVLEGVNVL